MSRGHRRRACDTASSAAVLVRAALGGRTGCGPSRVGAEPDAPWVERAVPLHAHEAGLDLHAAVHFAAAGDWGRLVQLAARLA
jgi:hypothetical protein